MPTNLLTKPCEECHGTGSAAVGNDYGGHHHSLVIWCDVCNGAGTVPTTTEERIEALCKAEIARMEGE